MLTPVTAARARPHLNTRTLSEGERFNFSSPEDKSLICLSPPPPPGLKARISRDALSSIQKTHLAEPAKLVDGETSSSEPTCSCRASANERAEVSALGIAMSVVVRRRVFNASHAIAPRAAAAPAAVDCRLCVDQRASALGVTNPEMWYSVSCRKFAAERTGKSLLVRFGSMMNCLRAAYPEHAFLPWKFQRVPRGYWSEVRHQRELFQHLLEHLPQLKNNPAHWQSLSLRSVDRKYKLQSIVNAFYSGNLRQALLINFPELNWPSLWPSSSSSSFHTNPTVPSTLGASVAETEIHGASAKVTLRQQRLRANVEQLAHQLKLPISTLSDWYSVSPSILNATQSGTALLRGRHLGLYSLLKDAYSHHHWLPWRFMAAPRSLWKKRSMHRAYFDWVAAELHLEHPSDWASIRAKDLELLNGSYLLEGYYAGSLFEALQIVYPEADWSMLPPPGNQPAAAVQPSILAP